MTHLTSGKEHFNLEKTCYWTLLISARTVDRSSKDPKIIIFITYFGFL